ncbi:MAG: superoxide dismutase family protein [Candidatus Omnitrophica bacterium]|nr:superoxide dismutase family protein [Candidatus Omnitrophota bacterium]
MKKNYFALILSVLLVFTAGKGLASEKGSMMEDVAGENKGSMMEYKHKRYIGAKAVAQILGTAEGSSINGTVEFVETENGVQVSANVAGVAAGKHGIHIHEYGSCDDSGKAAGGHYNPKEVQHGYLPKDGLDSAHAGDMGNIEIDDQGNGTLSVELPGLSIASVKNIAGRAVILHEKEDDFGQPTGNAGGRIACGAIVISGQ